MKLLDPAIMLFSLFASCFLSIIFLNFHSILKIALFAFLTFSSSPTVDFLFKWDIPVHKFKLLVTSFLITSKLKLNTNVVINGVWCWFSSQYFFNHFQLDLQSKLNSSNVMQ